MMMGSALARSSTPHHRSCDRRARSIYPIRDTGPGGERACTAAGVRYHAEIFLMRRTEVGEDVPHRAGRGGGDPRAPGPARFCPLVLSWIRATFRIGRLPHVIRGHQPVASPYASRNEMIVNQPPSIGMAILRLSTTSVPSETKPTSSGRTMTGAEWYSSEKICMYIT